MGLNRAHVRLKQGSGILHKIKTPEGQAPQPGCPHDSPFFISY